MARVHWIDAIIGKLAAGKRIRAALPGGGRLQIDRALPFLCVHRTPADRPDGGTGRLLSGESSFLSAPWNRLNRVGLSRLVQRTAETLETQFGAVLIVELWSRPEEPLDYEPGEENGNHPEFRIMTSGAAGLQPTVRVLESSLKSFRLQGRTAKVLAEKVRGRIGPPGMPALIPASWLKSPDRFYVGVEIRPVYRDLSSESGCGVLPEVLRGLSRPLSRSLRKALFEFSRRTANRPPHFQALGPRIVTRAAQDVDRRLVGICEQFDYLIQVTPVNAHAAWLGFKKSGFGKIPDFQYRSLPFDAVGLKRRLFQIPLEKLEDPALEELFREKMEEIDRLINLTVDCGTSRFLPGSLQVFGGVEEPLLETARAILERIGPRSGRRSPSRPLKADGIVRMAEEEIAAYGRADPGFSASVRMRTDVPEGILVSRGEMLLGHRTTLPPWRATALMHHEIGVHLVTHFNGSAQPFRLLAHGLADYEAFQEGLAVLAEHLSGGLTPSRLRLLAARVVAVHALLEGADFVEGYRLLNREFGFSQKAAYNVTMRVFRGGGLTKDAVYLRGLLEVLDYFRKGGDEQILWTGKMARRHLPILQELRWRKVLAPSRITPRFMEASGAEKRLLTLRAGATVFDLIE